MGPREAGVWPCVFWSRASPCRCTLTFPPLKNAGTNWPHWSMAASGGSVDARRELSRIDPSFPPDVARHAGVIVQGALQS